MAEPCPFPGRRLDRHAADPDRLRQAEVRRQAGRTAAACPAARGRGRAPPGRALGRGARRGPGRVG